ncbi:MAG: anthranilate synthase component I [Omnitrophica bacterium RBG_13_46_9]|nr:MAG: anthranilate synthase component I [Omnitrophica bacterium RBG_13_46_9]
MYYPSKKEFVKLAKKGNLIPVYREVLADFETPLSAFAKIDEGKFSYLLESVVGGERIARYSFLGSTPSLVFMSKCRDITIIEGGKKKVFKTRKDPLEEIKNMMGKFSFVPVKGLPRFCGGLVGYIGYDAVRFFERIPDNNIDDLNLPDSLFVLTDTILIFDHVDHKIKVVSNAFVGKNPSASYDEAVKKIEGLVRRLSKSEKSMPLVRKPRKSGINSSVVSNLTKPQFTRIVERAREYIRSGDIIQVVLSQRFKRGFNCDPFDIYRALRSINPSPYMFYLKFGKLKLIGASPEIMVRCEDRKAELRPIAGTRRRGRDEREDNFMMKDLLSDPKEKAEHIMLVDLGRNDIGRVCRFDTVSVQEFMAVEKYSHVMHIVSDVSGVLKRGKDIFDLVRATFPAGTVAGAPKIRAMEIIDELENVKRGIYAGTVGYFSFSGNLDTCIAIRTILIKGNTAYAQAGAGIVADSRPEREYKETLNKAKAMLKAIQEAERGLR